MYSIGSALLFGVSILLLLLNANASPLPATTILDEFRVTPMPLPEKLHPINLSSISSMLCQDNVRSKGCEPPAQLTKKEEHPVPTSLCGENCKILEGECICPHRDSAWPFIGPFIPLSATTSIDEFRITPMPLPGKLHPINLSSISSIFCQDNVRSKGCEPPAALTKKEEHPVPTSLCGGNCKIIEGECMCPHRDSTWPFIGPFIPLPITGVDGKPTPNPTPTKMTPLEHRPALETRALDGTKPHHTLSPRDNEEELCHKNRGCNRWQGNLPPTEAEVISKRDIDQPNLTYRDDAAEPTVTQASTATHLPTPATVIAPCDRRDVKCLNRHHNYHCDPSKRKCFFDFLPHTAPEEPSPTPTAALKECPENDRQCQGSFLAPPQLEKDKHKNPEKLCGVDDRECQENGHFPPAKAEKEERRNVDIVLPTANGTSEVKPDVDCSGMPYLCL